MSKGRWRAGHLSPRLLALGTTAVLGVGVAACGNDDEQITAGLITKQDTNPFFVKIEDTAKKAAGDENVKLLTATGKSDVDNESQVAALEDMTEQGAKGILITPADSTARGIRTGEIDATSQQYPENMASKGVQAVAAAARGGRKPSGYLDTGLKLIAADEVDGVASEGEAFGVRNCWG